MKKGSIKERRARGKGMKENYKEKGDWQPGRLDYYGEKRKTKDYAPKGGGRGGGKHTRHREGEINKIVVRG